MKVLTIIVPTYNMEQFLAKGLNSLLVREELRDDLEVLVINDGSRDRSSEIGHSFQNNYPQVFRVIDKPNGNYGSCVNRGLEEALGKYVRVMDSDDYFLTSGLEAELVLLRDIDVDLLLTPFYDENFVSGKKRLNEMTLPQGRILPIEDVIYDKSFQNVDMHKITYKTENLRKIGYTQTEGISYTDQEWCFLPMTTVKSVYYLNRIVYMYQIGRSGQTVETNVFVKNISQPQRLLFRMIGQFNMMKSSLPKEFIMFLRHRMEHLVELIYSGYIVWSDQIDSQELKDFDSMLKMRDIDLYMASEDFLTLSIHHFKYIKAWRRNTKFDRCLLKLLHTSFSYISKLLANKS